MEKLKFGRLYCFDLVKGIYIVLLVVIHATNMLNISASTPAYPAESVPTIRGSNNSFQEFLFGIYLISGWLANTTMNFDLGSKTHLKKKVERLLPTLFLGSLPLTFGWYVGASLNVQQQE